MTDSGQFWSSPQSTAEIQRILQMLRDTSYGSMDPLQIILQMLRRGVPPASRRRVGTVFGGGSGGSGGSSGGPLMPPSDTPTIMP